MVKTRRLKPITQSTKAPESAVLVPIFSEMGPIVSRAMILLPAMIDSVPAAIIGGMPTSRAWATMCT